MDLAIMYIKNDIGIFAIILRYKVTTKIRTRTIFFHLVFKKINVANIFHVSYAYHHHNHQLSGKWIG